MTIATYVFGVVSALITLAVVIEMLRRRRLRERHAVKLADEVPVFVPGFDGKEPIALRHGVRPP